ncbi:RHS repeat-associated core domain-containing protein, partial [Arthrobacter sp. yr096]|uniref:RHS repeat-associated core domain-containing protein n=1 Tax=Arthrobacter sp. yr096 TaxID=1761750 RepID=UPI0008C3AE81
TTTRYTRDAAGRVTAVSNPLLGDAAFTHDPSGRITTATAGQYTQEWAYRDGALVEHSRAHTDDPGTADVTLIGREDGGRITALTRNGVTTRYGYDNAGQLITATTTTDSQNASASASVVGWGYDAGGRLLRETTPTGSRTYSYDAAGQLSSATEPDGSRTEYVYDGLGRRVRVIDPDGSWTEYAWGPTGYLTGTVERDRDGAEQSRHRLHVDALGELATVDETPLWWDTAAPVPTLAGANSTQILSLPGGVTGIGDAFTAPGWRAARPTDQHDPWAVLGNPTTPNPGSPGVANAGFSSVLPSGITLTAGGGIDIAGLEWLGARAYDPATRGFLSADPLAPVLGAGWDGNPYSYAGNNPLNTTDPTGLRPLSDADLKAYDGSSRGAFAAAGDWWHKNKEYVAGVAMVAVGGALMASGVGGPVGLALIGAGADTIIQKATTGSVNWGQVALTGAVGVVAGPLAGKVSSAVTAGLGRAGTAVSTQLLPAMGRAGSAVASGAARAGSAVSAVGSRVGTAVTAGVSRVSTGAGSYLSQLSAQQMGRAALTNGISGSIGNTGMYHLQRSPDNKWTLGGAIGAATGGFVSGAIGSQAGYLAVPIRGDLAKLVQFGVGAGGSVAGGAVDHAIRGEGYGIGEMAFDGAGGALLTRFPGASELSPNPGWMTHSMAAYGGAHAGAIVESVKFVGNELVEQGTGAPLWG